MGEDGGWPEPHTEDRVRRVGIGPVKIGYGKRDIRCVVTTVDQLAGLCAGPTPHRPGANVASRIAARRGVWVSVRETGGLLCAALGVYC